MLVDWMPLKNYRDLPAVPGVYVIRHRTTGKEYVGQSKNVRKRMVNHVAAVGQSGYFHNALRKHGAEAFEVCLWAQIEGEARGQLERDLIEQRGTFSPGGYNAALGGLGPNGQVWTDEQKARQSARVKGIPLADETKEKMRLSALTNNPFKGKKHSAEALARIAAATVKQHTGMKRSDRAKANISASLMGRAAPVLSAEARERVAAAHRGKPKPTSSRPGSLNPMYGIKGSAHPAAKTIGIWEPESMLPKVFESGCDAAKYLGVSQARISDYLAGRRKPKINCVVLVL